MTVRQLTEILKDVPQDLPVIFSVHPYCNGEEGQQVSVWESDGFVMIYAGIIPVKEYTIELNEEAKR